MSRCEINRVTMGTACRRRVPIHPVRQPAWPSEMHAEREEKTEERGVRATGASLGGTAYAAKGNGRRGWFRTASS